MTHIESPERHTIGTVDDLVDILRAEADREGELSGLSALDHGLQCADLLANAAPEDLELQVAGLVHDLGSRWSVDDAAHGDVGADAVGGLLGSRVAALLRLHIPAKRYLATTDPSYCRRLSTASRKTLVVQGGLMTANDVATFLHDVHYDAAVLLRRADDDAKVPGRPTAGLERWLRSIRLAAAGVPARVEARRVRRGDDGRTLAQPLRLDGVALAQRGDGRRLEVAGVVQPAASHTMARALGLES